MKMIYVRLFCSVILGITGTAALASQLSSKIASANADSLSADAQRVQEGKEKREELLKKLEGLSLDQLERLDKRVDAATQVENRAESFFTTLFTDKKKSIDQEEFSRLLWSFHSNDMSYSSLHTKALEALRGIVQKNNGTPSALPQVEAWQAWCQQGEFALNPKKSFTSLQVLQEAGRLLLAMSNIQLRNPDGPPEHPSAAPSLDTIQRNLAEAKKILAGSRPSNSEGNDSDSDSVSISSNESDDDEWKAVVADRVNRSDSSSDLVSQQETAALEEKINAQLLSAVFGSSGAW